MDRQYLNNVAYIVKQKENWDSFLEILEYEKRKLVDKLKGRQSADDLLILNGQIIMLENLTKVRDRALDAEKEYAINKR